MPCFSKPRRNQTLTQRKEEVRKKVTLIDKLIAARKVQVKIGPQGAVVFTGISDEDRADLTDICIYNMLMTRGTLAAKLKIRQAEELAGRKVSRAAIQAGIHSHDGGATWGRD